LGSRVRIPLPAFFHDEEKIIFKKNNLLGSFKSVKKSESDSTLSEKKNSATSNLLSKFHNVPTSQANQDPKETIISFGTKISGTLNSKDRVTIQGDMDGKIITQNTVHVDKSGNVIADIFALNIIIEGNVVGNINAKEGFELFATGSVVGEIKAAKISIKDSSSVKGKIEVGTIKDLPQLPESIKE
jgi:cytoskeletal protein CcmA (bactofilin family)